MTAKEEKVVELERELVDLYYEQKALTKRIAPLQKESYKIGERIREIEEEINTLRVKRLYLEDLLGTPLEDIAYLLKEDGYGSKVKHDALTKLLKPYSLVHNCYRPKTMQRSITMMISEEATSEDIVHIGTALLKIQKVLKSHDHKQKFSIMEDTLGQYGVFELAYLIDEKTWVITRTTYGSTTEVFRHENLLAALCEMQENYSYG